MSNGLDRLKYPEKYDPIVYPVSNIYSIWTTDEYIGQPSPKDVFKAINAANRNNKFEPSVSDLPPTPNSPTPPDSPASPATLLRIQNQPALTNRRREQDALMTAHSSLASVLVDTILLEMDQVRRGDF